MQYFDPFSRQFWVVVGAAVACGALIGLERQLRGKPAGMRTSILTCLSTMIFVHLGFAIGGPNSDPTRVLGQVVTGVGFLGAGVIVARHGVVHGVTTAAVIWSLAAIGATIACGYIRAAFTLAIVTVLVLTLVDRLELHSRWFSRGVHAPGNRRE